MSGRVVWRHRRPGGRAPEGGRARLVARALGAAATQRPERSRGHFEGVEGGLCGALTLVYGGGPLGARADTLRSAHPTGLAADSSGDPARTWLLFARGYRAAQSRGVAGKGKRKPAGASNATTVQ